MDKIDKELKEAGKVAGKANTKTPQMNSSLQQTVSNYTEMQKRYAELRAKGMRQADAALKAGSTATGRAALGRVGYQFEQLPGMKEYIAFLYEKRARSQVVDEIEIAEKLRDICSQAIDAGNFNAANKSVELLGSMIGAFKQTPNEVQARTGPKSTKEGNNLEAFKVDDNPDSTAKDKVAKISGLIKSLGIE